MFESITLAIRRKNIALERHRKIADSAVEPIVKPNGDDKGREGDRERRLRNPNGDDREK